MDELLYNQVSNNVVQRTRKLHQLSIDYLHMRLEFVKICTLAPLKQDGVLARE